MGASGVQSIGGLAEPGNGIIGASSTLGGTLTTGLLGDGSTYVRTGTLPGVANNVSGDKIAAEVFGYDRTSEPLGGSGPLRTTCVDSAYAATGSKHTIRIKCLYIFGLPMDVTTQRFGYASGCLV